MKKRWKQLILTLCLILCVFGNTVYVDAATQDSAIAQPLYTSIQTASAALSISGTTATATTCVTAKSQCTIIIHMNLQKKSGTTWTTIRTWSSTKMNAYSLNMSQTYTVSSGTYRIYSTVTAGGETAYVTSPTKTK